MIKRNSFKTKEFKTVKHSFRWGFEPVTLPPKCDHVHNYAVYKHMNDVLRNVGVDVWVSIELLGFNPYPHHHYARSYTYMSGVIYLGGG